MRSKRTETCMYMYLSATIKVADYVAKSLYGIKFNTADKTAGQLNQELVKVPNFLIRCTFRL